MELVSVHRLKGSFRQGKARQTGTQASKAGRQGREGGGAREQARRKGREERRGGGRAKKKNSERDEERTGTWGRQTGRERTST